MSKKIKEVFAEIYRAARVNREMMQQRQILEVPGVFDSVDLHISSADYNTLRAAHTAVCRIVFSPSTSQQCLSDRLVTFKSQRNISYDFD